jgi:hypothetical protein
MVLHRQAIDFDRESFPFVIYKRLRVTGPNIVFSYELPVGYSYFLKRLTIEFPTFDLTTGLVRSIANVQINDPGHNRGVNPIALDSCLLSSPGATFKVPAAATTVLYVNLVPTAQNADCFSVAMSAAALKFSKTLNLLTIFRSRIEMIFSGMVIASALPDDNAPGYIDVMINGRLNPELSESGWGKTQ